MNRREAFIAGASTTGALVIPTVALGAKKHMGPKFAADLHITHRGLHVDAEGPMGDWRWDADYGYIAAVLVQGHVKGHGMTERVHPEDRYWHATVTADRWHIRFHPGPAAAHGVLLIPDGREAYSYAWTVPVELVQR
jgi:hypothetical protein